MHGAVDGLVLGREQGFDLIVGLIHSAGAPGFLFGLAAQRVVQSQFVNGHRLAFSAQMSLRL